MFAFLLMVQAASPGTPARPVGLVSAEDYPRSALDRGEQGTAGIELLVAPDGKVDRCDVVMSTSYADLDAYTCQLVSKRAIFSPARYDDGRPAYSTFKTVINWAIDRPTAPKPIPPDLELQINQAPPGVKMPLQITLAFLSKTNGAITGCKLDDKSLPAPTELWQVACQSLGAQPGEIVRNEEGQPVESYNQATVRFTVGSGAQPTAH